ncbi:MAG: hypothetical protein IPK32_18350 [Verrucomicrobiaceae bacterium]|nr:hypothetical protein [Verrucomicrobiaceae bacterium]
MKSLCQFFSVLLGLFAAAWMTIGIIPFLGIFQWPALICCVLGVIFGVFPQRKIGLTINLVVGVVAIVRLLIGAGVA